MNRVLRRRWVAFLAVVVLVPAVVIGSYGFYLADSAGVLPWQEDPTRIPITPFADIPGFSLPATATPRPTQTPTAAAPTSTSEVSRAGGQEALAGDEKISGPDSTISAVRAG
jgi:hypothetical protein